MTKAEIKRQANKLKKELHEIYDRIDNLADETKTAAIGMTAKEIKNGMSANFLEMANILEIARDNATLAYSTLDDIYYK